MSAPVLLGIFAIVFTVLPIWWKAKAASIFLLLCAGNLLSTSAAGPLTNEIRDVVTTDSFPLQPVIRGALLLLPALLALLITRKSVKKKRALYHILPAVAAGILSYLWFIRVLPFEQMSSLEAAELTQQVIRVKDMALIAGILSVLVLLFAERPKPEDDKHKKKH